jgi:hypothetical protein
MAAACALATHSFMVMAAPLESMACAGTITVATLQRPAISA